MFKRKLCILVLMLVATGCGKSVDVKHEEMLKTTNTVPELKEKKVELAKTENGIMLFANKQAEGDLFKEITIQTKERSKVFPWSTSTNPTYYPVVKVGDFYTDNKEELAVIHTKGYGTGVLEQKVHVLNVADLSEIPVENPMDAAYKQVSSKITTAGDSVTVELEINKKKIEKKYKKSDAATWYEKVGYGAITEYTLKDNKLLATLSVNISPAETAGNLVVEYGKDLKVKSITFKD